VGFMRGRMGLVQGWPVDAHVHFHRRALVGPALDFAAANSLRIRNRANGLIGVLLLAQSANERVFEELRAGPATESGWQIAPASGEPESLIARKGERSLAIVCGRQVRAQDGLEVLALGTREEFKDGRSFAETVGAVVRSGAISVLPWGFGKWRGVRGRIIEAALATMGAERVFLGDNGGRLSGAPRPSMVRRYEGRGFRVLPGSDPFPFGGDHQRIAGFGFLAERPVSEDTPWAGLREELRALRDSPQRFGRATPAFRFAFNQIGIQLWHRWPRSVSA
jgi:hypothetical protein